MIAQIKLNIVDVIYFDLLVDQMPTEWKRELVKSAGNIAEAKREALHLIGRGDKALLWFVRIIIVKQASLSRLKPSLNLR